MDEVAELRRIEFLRAEVLAFAEGLLQQVRERTLQVRVEARRRGVEELRVLGRNRQRDLPVLRQVRKRRLASARALRVERLHARDELRVRRAVEEEPRGLQHVARGIDGVEMHSDRVPVPARERHREYLPVALEARGVVRETESAAKRVRSVTAKRRQAAALS